MNYDYEFKSHMIIEKFVIDSKPRKFSWLHYQLTKDYIKEIKNLTIFDSLMRTRKWASDNYPEILL
jgi:hypothetical protein